MMTPEEIRSVTFDKTVRGYRVEDVDSFLQQAADAMDEMAANKKEVEQKLYVLAQKIEEYRKDEDNLKTALLNAQRMGESVIKEAKQKAEYMLREAGIKAEDLTRAAADKVRDEELELERIKAEVAQFKNSILGLYKQHIESLSALPGDEEELEEELDEAEELDQLQAQPAEEEELEEPELPESEAELDDPIENFPDLAALYQNAAAQQEPEEVPQQPEEPSETPKEPEAPAIEGFGGFQGIKFSD